MIEIKVYKNENIDDFSKDFLDSKQKLDSGSINAMSAALASTLFLKGISNLGVGERNDWLKRNAEILRTYFIHLIDDDLKARRGYLKELKAGNEDNIEAAIHPACSINEEIINMLTQMLDMILESCSVVEKSEIHYLKEASDLSMGTVKSCIEWLLNIVSNSIDSTYKYVVTRENEITLEKCTETWNQIQKF